MQTRDGREPDNGAGVPRFAILDAPIDCSGAGRREERALRAAGLVERLGARDAGAADARIRHATRPPIPAWSGAAEVRRASTTIAFCVRELLEARERPLVLGDDCTLCSVSFRNSRAGAASGSSTGTRTSSMGRARRPARRPTWTSRSSPATGRPGCSSETNRCSSHPPSCCSDIAPPSFTPTSPARTLASTQPSMPSPHPRCASAAPPASVPKAAARLAERPAWLHLDVDVLDEGVLPAVSYPQPLGLGWDELLALMRALVAAPNLLGLSVADFNPDRDADGTHAARVGEALESLCRG